MKTNLFKQLIFLFFAIILLSGCHSDTTENELPILQENTLTLDMLPNHIQQQAIQAEAYFQNMGDTFTNLNVHAKNNNIKTSQEEEGGFGPIDPSIATHKIDRAGRDTYALAMEKGNEPRAMDNMVIVDQGDGSATAYVVRHLPTDEWYLENISNPGFDNGFSGTLQIFSEEQGLLLSSKLEDGQLVNENGTPNNIKDTNTISRSAGGSCTIVDVTYAGLMQGDTFYVSDIIISVWCSGGAGTSGGGDPFGGGPGGGSNDDGEGGSGGSSGGGGTSTSFFDYEHISVWAPLDTELILEELAPETPVENLEEFLSCFDTSKPAVITVYANQPINNSPLPITFDNQGQPDPGHAFISISQNGKTATFGFYPDEEGIKAALPSDSAIGNNGGDSYDVSISKTVTPEQLAQIINTATDYNSKYELNLYNCTNYARDLGNLAGMNIPSAWGLYPGVLGGGQNPGKLGQVIRNMNASQGITINKQGGTAPSKNSGCN